MFSQREFAAIVAFVHRADLGHGNVAFIRENNGIVRNEFKQCGRRFPRRAAGQIAAIVFNAIANAGRLEHFQIKIRALFKPLRFEQFTLFFELL